MKHLICVCQTLARQLAEVLLRGVCEKTYQLIDVGESSADKSHPRPQKYSGDRSASFQHSVIF